MRILCLKATRIEVEPKKYAALDAHHEYYLDDDKAQQLIDDDCAVELDASGQRVEPSQVQPSAAKKTAARKPPAVKPTGTAGKPGGKRAAKAVEPPENKQDTEPPPADDGSVADSGPSGDGSV